MLYQHKKTFDSIAYFAHQTTCTRRLCQRTYTCKPFLVYTWPKSHSCANRSALRSALIQTSILCSCTDISIKMWDRDIHLGCPHLKLGLILSFSIKSNQCSKIILQRKLSKGPCCLLPPTAREYVVLFCSWESLLTLGLIHLRVSLNLRRLSHVNSYSKGQMAP